MNHLTEEQINQYVDLLLSNAEAEAVERHLLGCAICQKKIDELQQVFTALADLPEMPYQKDLSTRVLRLVDLPPATVPEHKPKRKFLGWASGLAWAIAVLQVPLAGLALGYTWPMLRALLVPIAPYFSQRWQGLSLGNGLVAWWHGWSGQVLHGIESLSTPPHVPNWNSQEGLLILAVLLAAWIAGNNLLLNANHKFIHKVVH